MSPLTLRMTLMRVYPRACGGTGTRPGGSHWPRIRVYPRACGGTRNSLAPAASQPASGSIPARAGEPGRTRLDTYYQWRGSIPARAGEPACDLAALGIRESGSIPARAGEPGASLSE